MASVLGASGSLIVGASAGSSFPLIDGRGVGAATVFSGTATGALFFSAALGASTTGEAVRDGSPEPPRALTEASSSSWYDVLGAARANAGAGEDWTGLKGERGG